MSVLENLHPIEEPSSFPFVRDVASQLPPVAAWVWFVLAIALVAGFVLQMRRRDWTYEERGALMCMPVALAGFTLTFLGGLISVPFGDWPADRLAATFAIVKGYRLFYGPHEGPILDFMYGPVGALVYLPATLATTPTPALLAGGFINAALFFVPLPWLVWRLRGRGRRASVWMIAAATACAVAFVGSTLGVFVIHVDAPALCFALLACVPLMYRRRANTARDFVLSSVFLTAAVWSKQTMAPLAVALPTFVCLADGWPACKAYLARAVPIGLGVSLVLALAFGPEEMVFNMLTIPARHPWDPPGLEGLVQATVEMLGLMRFYVAALAILPFAEPESLPRSRSAWRLWLQEHPWTLLVFAALALAPTGALSRIKVGGMPSSFHSNYLLIAAVIVGWTDMILTNARATMRRLGCVVLLVITVSGTYARRDLWQWLPLWQRPDDNAHEVAYRLATRYPGQLFFPWDVLATLLAEGELYHFAYGLFDRELAGFAPSEDHFREHLPKNLLAIGYFGSYPGMMPDSIIQKNLPKFTRVVVSDDVPSLVLWTRWN